MLNKIAKAATRYPQTKTSQRASSQLNAKLRTLQEQIKDAAEKSDPLPMLKEVHGSKLCQEVWGMLNEPNAEIMQQPNPHLAPEVRTRGQGFTICHALDAVVNVMGHHYDLKPPPRSNDRKANPQDISKANDRAFQEQIKPEFEEKLKSEFRSGWSKFDTRFFTKSYTTAEKEKERMSRMAAVLSAVAPDALTSFHLSYPKEVAELARQWGEIPPEMQLSKSELLALIDYVNSQSGTFNGSNAVDMASAYYGEKALANVTQVFTTALHGAVNKLCAHPYFGRTNLTAYKGIKMDNPAGTFRLSMLESAVGTGKRIAFPQILSATSNENASYAMLKYSEGYHYECKFTLRKACDVDTFHDTHTKGEMEVIAPPGQKFIVTEKTIMEIACMESAGHEDVTRFVLVPAENQNL